MTTYIQKYKLIVESDRQKFTNELNERVKNGWVKSGELQVTFDIDKNCMCYSILISTTYNRTDKVVET